MPAPPLLTSVKTVVFDTRDRCLLIRRSARNRSFAGEWEWPGGKVETGEGLVEAARREVEEETGLAVTPTRLAGATEFEHPNGRILVIALEAKTRRQCVRLSAEHDAYAWVPLNELRHYRCVSAVAAFMRRYAHRKLDSLDRAKPRRRIRPK